MSDQPSTEKELTAEQATGVRRLRLLLPAAANFYDPSDSDERDVCRACHSCECGGSCPTAMEIVRQVIEDLGCGEDAWDWWIEHLEHGGVRIDRPAEGRPVQGCMVCATHRHEGRACLEHRHAPTSKPEEGNHV